MSQPTRTRKKNRRGHAPIGWITFQILTSWQTFVLLQLVVAALSAGR
jgi:hypothetical protein